MPHLEPERVLERFSTYLREDVREEIDDEFVAGQVGSMSSTLQYLSQQLELERDVTIRQRETLLDSLAEVEERCDDGTVREEARRARERIEEADTGDVDELETTLVSACNDVLESINAELDGEEAREARRPLYGFLRTRVEGQLELLGRDTE